MDVKVSPQFWGARSLEPTVPPFTHFEIWVADSLKSPQHVVCSLTKRHTEPFEVVLGKGDDGVSFAGVREAVNDG